jgi:hypothetical protein
LSGRVSGFFPRLLGMKAGAASTLMGASLFLLPLLAGARPAKRLSAWVPFAVSLIALLFLPFLAFGAILFHRFTVFALPFFLIGLKPSKTIRPVWRALAVPLIFGWMGLLSARTMNYDSDARDFNQILSKMDSNQRALSLMFTNGSDAFPAPVFLHFPAWYSATKNGVVDGSFAQGYQMLVVYKPFKSPTGQEGIEWFPQTFNWDRTHGGDYRYFVVHAPVDMGLKLFRSAPCRITLAAHSNLWWLYEKDSQCPSSKPF